MDASHPVFRTAVRVGQAAAAYHRAELLDAEHLPRGPALVVGNHGLFGWDALVFFYLVYRTTGRVPVGLADRKVFGGRAIQRILHCVGGVPGTRENAAQALRAGRLVVCYPGGSREVFKGPEQRYRLAWDRADGFARLACELNVAVVPFAGFGVDDTFVNFGHSQALLSRYGRYALPFAVGLGPLPLPVRLRFRFAPVIEPFHARRDPARLKRLVQGAVESLLEEHVHAAPAPAAALP